MFNVFKFEKKFTEYMQAENNEKKQKQIKKIHKGNAIIKRKSLI